MFLDATSNIKAASFCTCVIKWIALFLIISEYDKHATWIINKMESDGYTTG